MKEYFYTVTESMLELGLRGTELNLFAVIYGYSQRGDGICYASRKELARRCGVNSPRTIDAALDHLVERGLVLVTEIEINGQTVPAYSYNGGCAKVAGEGVQKLHGGCAKIARGGVQKLHGSIYKDKYKIKDIDNPPYNPPTQNEIEEYARQRGFADPAGFADYFWTICENNGWKMAGGKGKGIENWKNYIVSSWESRHKSQVFAKSTTGAREMSPEEFRKRFIK